MSFRDSQHYSAEQQANIVSHARTVGVPVFSDVDQQYLHRMLLPYNTTTVVVVASSCKRTRSLFPLTLLLAQSPIEFHVPSSSSESSSRWLRETQPSWFHSPTSSSKKPDFFHIKTSTAVVQVKLCSYQKRHGRFFCIFANKNSWDILTLQQ